MSWAVRLIFGSWYPKNHGLPYRSFQIEVSYRIPGLDLLLDESRDHGQPQGRGHGRPRGPHRGHPGQSRRLRPKGQTRIREIKNLSSYAQVINHAGMGSILNCLLHRSACPFSCFAFKRKKHQVFRIRKYVHINLAEYNYFNENINKKLVLGTYHCFRLTFCLHDELDIDEFSLSFTLRTFSN